jgi:hypothetical protein
MAVAHAQSPPVEAVRSLLRGLPVLGALVGATILVASIAKIELVPIRVGATCCLLGVAGLAAPRSRVQVAGRIFGFAALSIGVVATLLTATVHLTAGSDRTITRVAGTDAVATAVQASRLAFDHADAVVVVDRSDAGSFATASDQAMRFDAPVLLTAGQFVRRDVVTELRRLGARRARVVGMIAAQVVPRLRALGITPVIVPPVAVAADAHPSSRASGTIWVAASSSPADVLVASAAAAHDGSLLVVDARDGASAGRLHRATVNDRPVVAVGGSAALPAWLLRSAGG